MLPLIDEIKGSFAPDLVVNKVRPGAAVRSVAESLTAGMDSAGQPAGLDLSDEEIQEVITFLAGLDESVFAGTNREMWKLRMFFRPSAVANFLRERGVSHALFAQEGFFISLRRVLILFPHSARQVLLRPVRFAS